MRNKPIDIYKYNGHADSINKQTSRLAFLNSVSQLFPERIGKRLDFVNLGNVDFSTEKLLCNKFDVRGISYEYDKNIFKQAKKNAPSNVQVIHDNIFNHKYNEEQAIWIDSMFSICDMRINEFVNFLHKNQFTNKLVLAITLMRVSRNSPLTYGSIYQNYKDGGIVDHLSSYIENEYVKVEDSRVIKYANVDVATNQKRKSTEMMLYIFQIVKR